MSDAWIRSQVVRVAISNLGYGELEANNDGPLIRAIGGKPGQEWCALFAGYCYRRAHELLDLPPPAWCWRRPGKLEVGAKALVRALGRVGHWTTDPREAQPGDLIAWHRRTGLITWRGHVGVVERVDGEVVRTIEGNAGRYPARVRQLVHTPASERLYRIAGLGVPR